MIVTDIFDKGGIIVWVLAAYTFIALTILFERLIHFTFMGKPRRSEEKHLLEALRSGQPETIVAEMRGPEGRLLQGILAAWKEGIHDLNRVAIRLGSFELVRMERGFRTLSFLGNTAPLLGLLGTIIGMIKAFMVIEQAGGQVDAQALAGGIWEAMLTTGVGLAVAIPVLLLLHLLESSADKRAHSMRHYASLMLEYLPHIDDSSRVNDSSQVNGSSQVNDSLSVDDSSSLNDTTEQSDKVVHHRDGVVHAV